MTGFKVYHIKSVLSIHDLPRSFYDKATLTITYLCHQFWYICQPKYALCLRETQQNSYAIDNASKYVTQQYLGAIICLAPAYPRFGRHRQSVIDPNKPTLVKFWASWCPLCLATLQETHDWRDDPNLAGFNIITVASPTHLNEKNTQDFTDWYQVLQADYPNLPVLIDSSGQLIKELGVQVYPSWAILDKNGQLVYLNKGNLSFEQVSYLAKPTRARPA